MQSDGAVLDDGTEGLLDDWCVAKRKKDFKTADRLRDELRTRGVDAEKARPAGSMLRDIRAYERHQEPLPAYGHGVQHGVLASPNIPPAPALLHTPLAAPTFGSGGGTDLAVMQAAYSDGGLAALEQACYSGGAAAALQAAYLAGFSAGAAGMQQMQVPQMRVPQMQVPQMQVQYAVVPPMQVGNYGGNAGMASHKRYERETEDLLDEWCVAKRRWPKKHCNSRLPP